jgi:hypothetical protein
MTVMRGEPNVVGLALADDATGPIDASQQYVYTVLLLMRRMTMASWNAL